MAACRPERTLDLAAGTSEIFAKADLETYAIADDDSESWDRLSCSRFVGE